MRGGWVSSTTSHPEVRRAAAPGRGPDPVLPTFGPVLTLLPISVRALPGP
jgi:hypothetical protein